MNTQRQEIQEAVVLAVKEQMTIKEVASLLCKKIFYSILAYGTWSLRKRQGQCSKKTQDAQLAIAWKDEEADVHRETNTMPKRAGRTW